MRKSATTAHAYEVRPRKDKRGVDLISDVLPFGSLWYDGSNAISNADVANSAHAAEYTNKVPALREVKRLLRLHPHARFCTASHDKTHREFVYRPFQFQKRSQDFIGTHNKPLSVAIRVNS